MKKKLDFVTNSSSTSFIVVCKEDLSVEEFVNDMWENGIGESVKKELIRNIKNNLTHFQKGVNEVNAYSENDSLFDQIFYYFQNLWYNKMINGEKFCMSEGSIYSTTYKEYEDSDDNDFIRSFPEEYQFLIKEYNKQGNE